MTTVPKPSESSTSLASKRENSLKTATVTTRTPLHKEQEQTKPENRESRSAGGNTKESIDIEQQQRSRSAIQLDRSQTGSYSSYKSSSITGVQETQEESMTFAADELGNKVSKSTFSGEENEEEEFTAQFEASKTLNELQELNYGNVRQEYVSSTTTSNDQANLKPLSSLITAQKTGWKAMVQNLQNKTNNMVNRPLPQEKPPIQVDLNTENRTLAKEFVPPKPKDIMNLNQSPLQNQASIPPKSFQNQAIISPKSPIATCLTNQGVAQNTKRTLTPYPGQVNLIEKPIKDRIKEAINPEKSKMSTSVPSFKDYLHLHKSPTPANVSIASSVNKSPAYVKPQLLISNNTINLERSPIAKAPEFKSDANARRLVESASKAPHEQTKEKVKETKDLTMTEMKKKSENAPNNAMSAMNADKQPYGMLAATVVPSNFSSPKIQIVNQITMPMSAEKVKYQAISKAYNSVKGSSRKTNLVTELPIIFEDPEIDLQTKRVVNRQKQDREGRMVPETRKVTLQEKNIINERGNQKRSVKKSETQYSSELESESQSGSEESESEEEDESNSSKITEYTQVDTQDVSQVTKSGRAKMSKSRNDERKNRSIKSVSNTQITQEVSEEETSDDEDEYSYESDTSDETDSKGMSSSQRAVVEEAENFRTARLEEPLRDYITNTNTITQDASEYTDDSSEYAETTGSQSIEESYDQSVENTQQERTLKANMIEREKYQQFNEFLRGREEINLFRRPEKVNEIQRENIQNLAVRRTENFYEQNNPWKIPTASFGEREDLSTHKPVSSVDLMSKKYNEIEDRVWDLKGRQWMYDKEVRMLKVTLKTLNERIDSLFDLAEDRDEKKELLSLTSSELNQIFGDNS